MKPETLTAIINIAARLQRNAIEASVLRSGERFDARAEALDINFEALALAMGRKVEEREMAE